MKEPDVLIAGVITTYLLCAYPSFYSILKTLQKVSRKNMNIAQILMNCRDFSCYF